MEKNIYDNFLNTYLEILPTHISHSFKCCHLSQNNIRDPNFSLKKLAMFNKNTISIQNLFSLINSGLNSQFDTNYSYTENTYFRKNNVKIFINGRIVILSIIELLFIEGNSTSEEEEEDIFYIFDSGPTFEVIPDIDTFYKKHKLYLLDEYSKSFTSKQFIYNYEMALVIEDDKYYIYPPNTFSLHFDPEQDQREHERLQHRLQQRIGLHGSGVPEDNMTDVDKEQVMRNQGQENTFYLANNPPEFFNRYKQIAPQKPIDIPSYISQINTSVKLQGFNIPAFITYNIEHTLCSSKDCAVLPAQDKQFATYSIATTRLNELKKNIWLALYSYVDEDKQSLVSYLLIVELLSSLNVTLTSTPSSNVTEDNLRSISNFLGALLGSDDPARFYNFPLLFNVEKFGKDYFENIDKEKYEEFIVGVDSQFFKIFEEFCSTPPLTMDIAKETLLWLFINHIHQN